MSRALSPARASIELRWFGGILFLVFAVLGAVAELRFGARSAATSLWTVGVALAALYYTLPSIRVALYKSWLWLTMPLGRMVNRLVLGLVYFAVLTPIALILRLARRDRLALRFSRDAASYWRAHDPGSDPDRYFRQS